MIHFAHRSGAQTYQHCPRQYWLEYQLAGTGMRKHPQALHLDVGSAVHAGLAELLDSDNIEKAVVAALEYFANTEQRIFRELEMPEQNWLIECLLRAWNIAYWPAFKNQYQVLDVELPVVVDYDQDDITVRFQSRPDAIVKDRENGEHAGISWKTIDDLTDYRRIQFSHDLQGFTELYFGNIGLEQAAQDSFNEVANVKALKVPEHLKRRWVEELIERTTAPKLDYIQTIFFEKGKRKYLLAPEDGNREASDHDQELAAKQGYPYLQDTFLCRPWFNQAEGKFSHSYSYKKPENKTFSRLGKGWERVPIYLIGRIGPRVSNAAKWVEELHAREVFPSSDYRDTPSPLTQIITYDAPMYRSYAMMERVINQVVAQEFRITQNLVQIRSVLPLTDSERDQNAELINSHFPQTLAACTVPYHCEFKSICHGPNFESITFNEEIPDGFTVRQPHHEAEREARKVREVREEGSRGNGA